jgi:hypothetical protein
LPCPVTLGIIPGAGEPPAAIGAERPDLFCAKPVDVRAKASGSSTGHRGSRAGAIGTRDRSRAAGLAHRRDERGPPRAIFQRVTAARLIESERQPRCGGRCAGLAIHLAEGLNLRPRWPTTARRRRIAGAIHVFRRARLSPRPEWREVSATRSNPQVHQAGTIGGIAICLPMPASSDVVDANNAALERGLANVDRVYQSMVGRGRLTADEKAQRMARIRTTLDYDQLRDADVIVEAVFESMDLKREVFAKREAVARRGAVLATTLRRISRPSPLPPRVRKT